MKVVCINTDGWEEEETKTKVPGPEFDHEYDVMEEDDGFYQLIQYPGCWFDLNEFVPSVQLSEAEEKFLNKIFSH